VVALFGLLATALVVQSRREARVMAGWVDSLGVSAGEVDFRITPDSIRLAREAAARAAVARQRRDSIARVRAAALARARAADSARQADSLAAAGVPAPPGAPTVPAPPAADSTNDGRAGAVPGASGR
jgi:hypothetical protein